MGLNLLLSSSRSGIKKESMNAMNERRDFLRSFSFLRPRHNAVQKGDGRGRSRRCLRHIKGGNSALFLLRSIGTLRWNRCPRKYPQQTPLGAQNRAQGEKEEQQSQCGFIRFYFPLPFSLIKKKKKKKNPKNRDERRPVLASAKNAPSEESDRFQQTLQGNKKAE